MKQSTRRLLTYGSNATLVTGMVIAVVVLIYVLADLYRVRVDLTEGSSNTLQVETLEKLRLLDQDGEEVVITAFTSQSGKEDSWYKNRAVKDLLTGIGANSKVVQWRLVDFDQERLTAEKLGVTDYGRIVIQRGADRVDIRDRELFRRAGKGSERRMEFIGEGAVVRSLAQLMTPTRRVVYALTGHGELDPEERGPDGMSELVGILDEERYDVERLDLLRSTREGELPTIPDDAAVILVARPRGPLSPQEEDMLLAWIGRGGAVLFALDVGASIPSLLDRMGVSLPEGVALQPEMQVPYRDRPIPRYRGHIITSELEQEKLVSVLALPAPVVVADPRPEGVKATPVLSTTRDGWIDRGGALQGGAATYEPALDGAGPVDMAWALELMPGKGLVRSSKSPARVLITGDADMFSNALVGEAPGNAALAVNAMHWLAGEDRRLGAEGGGVGRSNEVRRLALTQPQMGTVRLVSLGLLPSLVLLLGILMWNMRRGR